MPLQYEQQRSGVEDRRGQNEHCDMHLENSHKINTLMEKMAGLCSSVSVTKWIISVALTLVVPAFIGFYSLSIDYLKAMGNDIKDLKQITTTGQAQAAVSASQFNMRLTTLEHDVEEIESVIGKKRKLK